MTTRSALLMTTLLSVLLLRAPAVLAEQEPGPEPEPEAVTSTMAAFEAEVAEYERREDGGRATEDIGEMPNLFSALVQMVLVLGFVCLLAYLLLGKVLPKLMRVQQPTAPHRMLEVVDRLPLDQRRSIMVIKLGERYYLVGATEQGISLLSRLEAEEIEDALASAAARRDATSLGRFAGNLLNRARKEG